MGANLFSFFNDTNGETSDVEIVSSHHPTVFCGLSPEKSNPSLSTSLCNASDDFFDTRRINRTNGNVVKEEKWFSSHTDQVINTHRHKVNTDCVVAISGPCDVDLGSHSVGSRNQNGVAILLGVDFEETAKPTDCAKHARSVR